MPSANTPNHTCQISLDIAQTRFRPKYLMVRLHPSFKTIPVIWRFFHDWFTFKLIFFWKSACCSLQVFDTLMSLMTVFGIYFVKSLSALQVEQIMKVQRMQVYMVLGCLLAKASIYRPKSWLVHQSFPRGYYCEHFEHLIGDHLYFPSLSSLSINNTTAQLH